MSSPTLALVHNKLSQYGRSVAFTEAKTRQRPAMCPESRIIEMESRNTQLEDELDNTKEKLKVYEASENV